MRPDGLWSPRGSGPIYLGVGLVISGVLLIVLTWYKIAELVLVPAQFPLLVSGGLTGLVLVLVGLTLVNVHVKRQESAKRIAAINRLTRTVAEQGPAVRSQPTASDAGVTELSPAAHDQHEMPVDDLRHGSRSMWG